MDWSQIKSIYNKYKSNWNKFLNDKELDKLISDYLKVSTTANKARALDRIKIIADDASIPANDEDALGILAHLLGSASVNNSFSDTLNKINGLYNASMSTNNSSDSKDFSEFDYQYNRRSVLNAKDITDVSAPLLKLMDALHDKNII